MFLNPYIAGNPIGGQTGFFGRDDILREVMQVLRHPESNAIVLYGQRRIGKTSTLLQLERQLTDAADYIPVYFDLQDKADKPLDEVLYELAQRISVVTKQAMPDRGLFDSQGAYFRDTFVPQAATMGTNSGLVLLFDEFDVLDSPKEDQAGAAFFPYLRRWMGDAEQTMFVFVIGRRPEDLSIKTISTFKGVRATRVSLLNQTDAAAVVRQSEADDSLLWPDKVVKQVWYWAQGHPYFTQLLCSVIWESIYEDDPEETPTATVDDVDTAIDEALKQGANAFAWIWDGLPPAERVVVSAMAEAKEPIITHDDLVNILNQSGVRLIVRQLELAPETLVEWGLLQPTNGGYQFTVLLLRDWVRRNRPLRRTKEELDLLDPQAESLFQTGQRFYQSKQLETAKSQLRLALDTNPNHLKAQLMLGQILFEQKRLDEAIEVLETAYQYDAISARSDLVRVLLAFANGQDESAQLKTYQHILDIQSDQPTAKENILSIHINEASFFVEEGQWAEAIQVYEKLLEKFANDERVEKHLQAARIGKREQQISTGIKKALQFESKGQWSKAVPIYATLLTQFPDTERIKERLQAAQLAEHIETGRQPRKQEIWSSVKLKYAVMGIVTAIGILFLASFYLNSLINSNVVTSLSTPTSISFPSRIPFTLPTNPTQGSAWTRPSDEMVMVYVPAGSFMMGSNPDDDPDAYDDELPQHEVTMDGFWIDQTEVTNVQYSKCLESGGCDTSDLPSYDSVNGDQQPMSVGWYYAEAYCEWTGGKLPTEAQWEYAARGNDGRLYPWGNESPTCGLTQFDDCAGATLPVGSLSPSGDSWVGAQDMGGNAWEWVADWYDEDYYANTPEMNPTGPLEGNWKVMRGGSWTYSAQFVRSAERRAASPGTILGYGFRCAISGQ